MKNKFIILMACIIAGVMVFVGCNKNNTADVQAETTEIVRTAVMETTVDKIETAPETTTVEETATETSTKEETTTEKITIEDNTTEEFTTQPPEPEPESIMETEPEPAKTVEELVEMVFNGGYNGEARKEFLGDRYEEVQKYIDENYAPPAAVYEDNYDDYGYSYPSGGGVLTPDAGINYHDGVLETYYNLDMSWNIDVMRGMGFDEVNYPYWVRSDGCKMLGDYIMVAADFGWEPRGTITYTSLGPAVVVDTGGGGWYWHDICVVWE